MNKLILQILPIIEQVAKRTTRNTDTQNELKQIIILKCYDNEDTVKRLFVEKKITQWIVTVMWNDYLYLIKHEPIDSKIKESEDLKSEDLMEQMILKLDNTERAWVKAYLYDGSYVAIEKRTGIQRKYISERIRNILEKCKTFKHTL